MSERATAAALAALTAAGLALRAMELDQSLFGDELFTHEIATRPGVRDVLAGVRSELEVSPPLHFVAAWAAAKLGDPQAWLRVPSLLAGTAAIPLTYLLGARTAGRAAGLAGAGLVALSPFALFYSVEARPFALAMALALGSTIALLGALSRPGAGRWLLFTGLAAAALYTHYTAAPVLAAQGLWALWAHPGLRGRLLAAHAGVLLAFAPWLPFMLEDASSPTQAFNARLAPLSPSSLGDALFTWSAGMPFTSAGEVPGVAALVLACAGLVLAAAALVLPGAARRGREAGLERRRGLALLAALALSGPAGAVAFSLGGSSFLARNLLVSLPALALLAGALLTAPPRRPATAAVVLAGVGFALGAASMLDEDHRRPAYGEAAELVERRLAPGEPVLELLPIPTRSPAARALELELDRSHPLYRAGVGNGTARALEAGRGGRLALVGPARRQVGLPQGRARLIERSTLPGIEPLSVAVYSVGTGSIVPAAP